jgi:hypothetical protein
LTETHIKKLQSSIFLDVIGFLIYFFNMECHNCCYISFKQEKNCGSCGFNFKKAATSPESLFRNDSFTIFSRPKSFAEESLGASTPQVGEGIAVIDPPKSSQENQEFSSGEFLLGLSTTNKEEPDTSLKTDASEPDIDGFMPMKFGTDADINLEEIEVEGLGLGLEPLEEDSEISNSNSEDITLNISDLVEEAKIELELASSSSQSPKQDTAEPVPPPVLDLGNTEIILDLAKDSEPEGPKPSSLPAQSDELALKLEIDDSNGPLTINDDEIPEVEIENLGLELEDPPPFDPEKL